MVEQILARVAVLAVTIQTPFQTLVAQVALEWLLFHHQQRRRLQQAPQQ
jgi:hypothetical protein